MKIDLGINKEELDYFKDNCHDTNDFKKQYPHYSHLSDIEIYSLLLNVAILFAHAETISYTLSKATEETISYILNKARGNIFTIRDLDDRSPIVRALEYGSMKILDMIEQYIADNEIIKSEMDDESYNHIFSALKFTNFGDWCDEKDIYRKFVVPLYIGNRLHGALEQYFEEDFSC